MNRKIVDESIHDLFFRKMPPKELKNQRKSYTLVPETTLFVTER